MPWAFKLDHLQPVKPIVSQKFSNFSTFILGANSYYPKETKTENGILPFWVREGDFSAHGIQTGPFFSAC